MRGKASWQVGDIAAKRYFRTLSFMNFCGWHLSRCERKEHGNYPFKAVIAGAVRAIPDEDKRELLLKAIGADVPEDHMARLCSSRLSATNLEVGR